MSDNETGPVAAEVAEWFFGNYLPTWVGVGSGAIDKDPGSSWTTGGCRCMTTTPTVVSGRWTVMASPGCST